jgi:hypothetical protein
MRDARTRGCRPKPGTAPRSASGRSTQEALPHIPRSRGYTYKRLPDRDRSSIMIPVGSPRQSAHAARSRGQGTMQQAAKGQHANKSSGIAK